jgi:hypothetical protein
MLKLTKAEEKAKAVHVAALRTAELELDGALETFCRKMAALCDELRDANLKHAIALETIRDWRDGLVQRWQEEIDERSDKWHDSDAGNATKEWVEAWDAIDLDEVELDLPDELSVPEFEAADNLEDLGDAPETGDE